MMIGDRIQRARQQLGLTLEDVSKRIGLSRQTLSRYETGVIQNIPSDTVEKLAAILETSPGYLMGWTEEAKREAAYANGNGEMKDIREQLRRGPVQGLFKRTKALTDKQVELMNSIADAMIRERDGE